MTHRLGRSRPGETGLVRGCCLGLVLLAGLVAATVILGQRVLAAPNLGGAPRGPSHGSSEVVIAATLAGAASSELLNGEHASVTLSERDLTVIALARNPSPNRFRNPQARVRNGDIVVSANTDVGPFGVTAVARFALVVRTTSAGAQLTAQVIDFAVGQPSSRTRFQSFTVGRSDASSVFLSRQDRAPGFLGYLVRSLPGGNSQSCKPAERVRRSRSADHWCFDG